MAKVQSELQSFRAEKDHVFSHDPNSPLPSDERRNFKGLTYFDENPNLVITATIDRDVEPGEVRLGTTGGEEQVYRRYGIVRFRVEGEPAQLTLYASDDSDSSSCHFATRPRGTSPTVPAAISSCTRGDDVDIDFHYAYN